jgi:DNA-binding SARP family transcriptional activator
MLSQLQDMGDTEMGRACRTMLGALPQPPAPGLRVTTLGRFQLFRGDEEVPAQAWSSRKARMLFKLLAHYRPKGFVNKEIFMEHLWPEEDPQRTAKRFHVALASLRKILEPAVHRGVTSSYILSEGDNYLLDVDGDGTVDVEEFERACTCAAEAPDNEAAVRHLLRAADLCRGDFLEEDLYEPWGIAERERVREKHLSVLASIAEYYEVKRDYARAVEFCSRYLAKDSYAEDMYQRLMRLHNLLGNRAMVKKTYEKCRKSMDDLACPLSSETRDLARELMGE